MAVFEGTFAAIAFDCEGDPAPVARWWHEYLGGEIEVDEEGGSVYREGFPPIDFLRAPEPKTVKNRLHLDLRATDFDAAVRAAVAHGATTAEDVYAGDRWQVLRDPFGNEFCILRPRP
jgi:hypothetical protein